MATFAKKIKFMSHILEQRALVTLYWRQTIINIQFP